MVLHSRILQHHKCIVAYTKWYSTLPDFTKNRYPTLKRGNYTIPNEEHYGYFHQLLGTNRVITDPIECDGYNIDFVKNVRGSSSCVVKPKTTEEMSAILRFCNEHRLAVCPQGGNTGLVAGSVPVFDEIIVSTTLMKQIVNLDKIAGILTCQSGCILETLDDELSKYDLMMPLDLGAKGSCQIGGNASTNAGGLRLLRYGSLHGTITGIEAVTATGQIIDCLSTFKKDNTGFHLKHLFIGSEGQLGVITKVAIQCPPKPKAVNLALFGVETYAQILEIFHSAKNELGEILSAFEMMDSDALSTVTEHVGLKTPLNDKYPFYVLIETHGSQMEHDEEKLTKFLQHLMDQNRILNGTTTNEPSKMKSIWDLREKIAEAILYDGYVLKYDFSLPLPHFYSIVPIMKQRLGNLAIRCCGYGHIGDCNLHLNISLPEYNQAIITEKIEPFVYDYVAKMRGSISAEHGIGFKKTKYLHYAKSTEAIDLMKGLKKLMDPNNILNPYKVLPF